MTLFHYKAKTRSAQTVAGEITADTRDDAVEKISQQGLMPITVDDHAAKDIGSLSALSGRVSLKELYHFSRQLAQLLKAGIPLLRGLEIVAEQTADSYFRQVMNRLYFGIKDGKAFADCLGMHPKVFSPLYVAMIRAGEESGQLVQMLLTLAEYLKSQGEIISKVRSALAYPFIMAIVGLGTIVFMLIFVMPRITGLLMDMQQSLPLPTVILIEISGFLKRGWHIIILSMIILGGMGYQSFKSERGHRKFSAFQLGLPFFGKLIFKIQFARFCRSLELLLKSGISLLRALRLSTPLIENDLIREQVEKCHGDLSGGGSLGQSLKRSKLIPGVIGDLIAVGEESGALTTTLHDLADEYELEINEHIKVMTTLLEPFMIIGVGGVVGFIVIAMLLPIFELNIVR